MSWIKKNARLVAHVAGIGVVAFSAAAIAAQAPGEAAPVLSAPAASEDVDVAAANLAGAISAELVTLPDTSTAEDFEAFIIFRLDQGNYPPVVIERALALLGDSGDSPLLKTALDNVRLALLKRKRGTAALRNTNITGFGGGSPFGAPPFTSPPGPGGPSPTVGDCGGGSNYCS